jgi:hypothetical protein
MTEEVSHTATVSPQGVVVKQRLDVLELARSCWDSQRDFRERRKRSRDYFRGKPKEMMTHPETQEPISEDDYVIEQGRIPFKVNRISPIIRNLKGQFRQAKTSRMAYGVNRDDNEAGDMMTEALNMACRTNQTTEVDASEVMESLLGGFYGWSTGYKWNPELKANEISVDPIDPTRFFYNSDITDVRFQGLRICGEVFDVPVDAVIMQFAKTAAHEKFIRDMYADVQKAAEFPYEYLNYGFNLRDNLDFYTSDNPSLARVIVVWKLEYRWKKFVHDRSTGSYDEMDVTREQIEFINQQRMLEARIMGKTEFDEVTLQEQYDAVWHCYYLTPLGYVLHDSDTPYWHESNPYTLGLAQFIDGEVWGLIEDIIDQQRLSNRLVSAIDYMFGASAKGVLMVDEAQIPQGWTPAMFASEWTKFNGVIFYKAKPNVDAPHQVTQNSIPAGIFNWLMSLSGEMKEITGVTGPVMGHDPQSGTPASLYNQQVAQGELTTRDFFDSFYEVRRQRDLKVVKLIAQYYTESKMLAVSGRRPDGRKLLQYDPTRVRNIQWDIVVSDTPDTPASRQLMEEYLVDLMKNERLTFKQYLQLSSHPKADLILQTIEKTNPLLSGQQMNPAAVAQLQMTAQSGDPDAAALIRQAQ